MNTSITKQPLTADVIRHGALKLIRVLPGHLGLATHNGQPIILAPGRHLINDPLFVWVRQESMTCQHIEIGTVHLITIQQGRVGLCTVDATSHFMGTCAQSIINTEVIIHC